ncbi:hypothetical protein ACFOND_15740 [Reinekea marina]|uniref:Peptidase M48 domain-containing protein n=2 Tax=Reinekea marina TaxID=1310421 RepID=A0ABV7WWA3_9GAMM
MKFVLLTLFSLCLTSPIARATTQISPNDPTQYIRYWNDQIVDPANHEEVLWAHQIFDRLLRAWDYTRVAPTLNIIEATNGPWAASLADGNILLTRSAIRLIQEQHPTQADHLLAFVIAHELAHQRSDDLWHLKFYRMVGDQSPEQQSKVMGNLANADMADIEKAEAQADQDAIVLMASVGFDTQAVIQTQHQQDFYTTWVEQLWQNSCEQGVNTQFKIACAQAQLRALRTKSQIEAISAQAVLYEMGVQAMVTGDYEQARRYFTTYGRSYPNRAVLTSIGLTYLAEAFRVYQLHAANKETFPYYFPLFIDATPQLRPALVAKRGIQTHQGVNALAQKSLEYFTQAKKLAPDNPATYVLMISAYQMMNNTPMAAGILQGEYIARFGSDITSAYLQGINLLLDGKNSQALNLLSEVRDSQSKPQGLSLSQLQYAALMNMTGHYLRESQADTAKQLWLQYAQREQQAHSDLFQMALNQLQPNRMAKQSVSIPFAVQEYRIGEKWLKDRPDATAELWYNGAPFQLLTLDGRSIVVDDQARIISVWVTDNVRDMIDKVQMRWTIDRVITNLGTPSRRLDLVAGQYLAYDHLGLAVKIEQGVVHGWFYYLPSS